MEILYLLLQFSEESSKQSYHLRMTMRQRARSSESREVTECFLGEWENE